MFWFIVKLTEDNPPSLIFKVFVGTSSAKPFSSLWFSGEEIPPFLQPMPEKLFPNGFITAGMRLWVWFGGCKRAHRGQLMGRCAASMRLGCSHELKSFVSLGQALLWWWPWWWWWWCNNSSSSSSSIRLAFFQFSYTFPVKELMGSLT